MEYTLEKYVQKKPYIYVHGNSNSIEMSLLDEVRQNIMSSNQLDVNFQY